MRKTLIIIALSILLSFKVIPQNFSIYFSVEIQFIDNNGIDRVWRGNVISDLHRPPGVYLTSTVSGTVLQVESSVEYLALDTGCLEIRDVNIFENFNDRVELNPF